jgi:formylglycine-generating enzyme required for sulfatase activity
MRDHFVNILLDDGSVEFPVINIPSQKVSEGMTYYAGDTKFRMGADEVPGAQPVTVNVLPYYLDTTEMTVAEFRRLAGQLPPGMPRNAPGDYAVGAVTYDTAVYCAELAGKRLPDEAEYEYAATNGGKTRYPWGNDKKFPPWPLGRVREPDYDKTRTDPRVYGLYSNLAEWVATWPYPRGQAAARLKEKPWPFFEAEIRRSRVVRGGPFPVINGKPEDANELPPFHWDTRWRPGYPIESQYAGLGFRCARSAKPRFLRGTN